MQFTGKIDGAQSNGSEQVYLPTASSAWRPTSKVAVFDPDQTNLTSQGGTSPGPAAKLVYGRGYGLASAGMVVYEGGHNLAGTTPDNIAAQRAFLNLLFLSAAEKAVTLTTTVPATAAGGEVVSLSAAATSVTGGAINYAWTSSCGGTFSAPSAATTTFTAPFADSGNLSCILRVVASDGCARSSFDARDFTVLGKPDLQATITASTQTPAVNDPLTYTIVVDNIGGETTTDSHIFFTLPTGFAVTSITPSRGSCAGAPSVVCSFGDVTACDPEITIVVAGTVTGTGGLPLPVRVTTTAPDADLGNDPASTSPFVTVSGPFPVLTAEVSPTLTNRGGTLDYTLTVKNGGSVPLNNIHVQNPMPANTTFVAGSTAVDYLSYLNTVSDDFPTKSYSGSQGTTKWLASWTEIGDDNKAGRGNLQVATGNCAAGSTTFCAKIKSKVNGNGIIRSADTRALSGTLSFSYQVPTAKAATIGKVEISSDGGATFRLASTISLSSTSTTDNVVTIPLVESASVHELTAAVTKVRFTTTGTASAVWAVDKVKFNLQKPGVPVHAAGSAPNDLTASLNGLLSLLPGDVLTVTFRATVSATAPLSSDIDDIATVTATETGATATASNVARTTVRPGFAPVADGAALVVAEDAPPTAIGLTAPTDAGSALSALVVTATSVPVPTQGRVLMTDNSPVTVGKVFSIAELTALRFVPAADFNGQVRDFRYAVTDAESNVGVGVATFNVTAVNDAPVAFPDADVTQKGVAITFDDLPGANDTDIDGEIDDALLDLDPAAAGQQTTRTVAGQGTWTLDNVATSTTFLQVTFTPTATFTGIATVDYASCDTGTPLPSQCGASTLAVTVNDPPVAVNDTVSVNASGGQFLITGNDTDSDGLVDVSTVDLDPATAGMQTTLTTAADLHIVAHGVGSIFAGRRLWRHDYIHLSGGRF
jgi:uncharacterized repeat protein (TIGR01451 family)